MSLITLIVVLIAVGLIMYCVNTYLPLDASIKKILNIVVICVVVLWLLQVFGILGTIDSIRVGRIN